MEWYELQDAGITIFLVGAAAAVLIAFIRKIPVIQEWWHKTRQLEIDAQRENNERLMEVANVLKGHSQHTEKVLSLSQSNISALLEETATLRQEQRILRDHDTEKDKRLCELEERDRMREKEVEELRQAIRERDEEIDRLKEQLAAVEADRERLQNERDEERLKAEREKEELQERIDELEKEVKKLREQLKEKDKEDT
jgi:chromosome segregation ATPase